MRTIQTTVRESAQPNRKQRGIPPHREVMLGGGLLRCPACGKRRTTVIDARSTVKNHARRRRVCLDCGYRFTTYEMISPEDVIDYQI
jgi:hypothetical protein